MDHDEIRQAFERALNDPTSGATFLHRFLGVKLSVSGEVSTLVFEHKDYFANRQRNLHGGIMALLFDIAMGTLHRSVAGPAVTLELKTQYLRAFSEGSLTCEARFTKRGRHVSFMEGRMWNQEGKLIATATATWAAAG